MLRWLREQRWLDGAASVSQAGSVPADWRDTRSGVEGMGVRLGLGKWDLDKHRLFAAYEAEVVDSSRATTEARHDRPHPTPGFGSFPAPTDTGNSSPGVALFREVL